MLAENDKDVDVAYVMSVKGLEESLAEKVPFSTEG